MKIYLIGNSFDKKLGQGVYNFSWNLFVNLKKIKKEKIKKIELGVLKSIFSIISKNIIQNTIKSFGKRCNFLMPELAFPVLFKRNSIVTFHDLIPYTIGERKKLFIIYFKIMCNIAKRAKKIIAVSEATKKDLIKYLKIPDEKIVVVYEGVSKDFFPIKKVENKEFVVGYIGGLGKRKNVEFILKLAKQLPKIKFKIGGKGPDKERLEKIAKKLRLKNINFVGFVPDKEMNNFYNSLDVFLFPSLYEGFGLPVLEAMACGIPCIISDKGSLPEIVKNAGIVLDINSTLKSKEKIRELIKDKKLRIKMSKEGINRAKKFTWEKTARETLKVYEEVWR